MSTKLPLEANWDMRVWPLALKMMLYKLGPGRQLQNPILFSVYVCSIIMTGIFIYALFFQPEAIKVADGVLTLSLWFTILSANFAEAMAESRGKRRANMLRKSRREVQAKKLLAPNRDAKMSLIPAMYMRTGDFVLVEAGDIIPSDGEAIVGIASVDESAITGESAPVIRESDSERSFVTGGTRVISDWLIIEVTADPGETYIDHMIELIEGSQRQRTVNEIALTVFLIFFTCALITVCFTLLPVTWFITDSRTTGNVVPLNLLIPFFVAIAPTSIGGLLSTMSIAGMDRLIQANVIATSNRVVESAADVNVLLLDKTGTVTLGNRQATAFIPAADVDIKKLADAAQLASLADETPEGRSIVVLAKEKYFLRARDLENLGATFIPFTAQTRMSGANIQGRQIRKGAISAVEAYVKQMGGSIPASVMQAVESVSRQGATALVVAEGAHVLGVIALKDIVKGGTRERFAEIRRMGIKTIMVTGDNPLTAAAIAAEAGVDDFLANATPEDKLALIRRLQAQGLLVAMAGDDINDAPALAQADVALAMNTGTQAAKEAGNLVDLDSNPTKLIEVVEIGKQLLMTRGALTILSIVTNIAKYILVLPLLFMVTYPSMKACNIFHLGSPLSAMLATSLFSSLMIIFMIPIALKGVVYQPQSANKLFARHFLYYGVGGFFATLIGIKLLDFIIHSVTGV